MWISYSLTLIFMSCALVVVGFAAFFGKKIKKYSRRSLESIALMLGKLEEAITGLPVVKVYNRQDHERAAYRKVNRKWLRHTLRIAKVKSATGPVMEVLGVIAGSAALLVGVSWVAGGRMLPSEFFGLLVALGAAAESVRRTSDVWNKIQQADAAAERVFSVVDQPAESEKADAIDLAPLKDKIEFKDVVFTYPGNNGPTLKGISLTVQSGRRIAIVGPNGSGKTTLVNLIPRFFDVDSGAVLIDGRDVRQGTLWSLRDQIGLVGQNVVTFNDTIAANIAYGKHKATMHDILEAAKGAYVHEFISPLPDGYETFIGEHGAGFSGGQLQRIAIARAILKNPPILIFDEAMSQVDADSEAKIHKALSGLMQDRTCFVIAHRFSTIISADTIVVMNEGRIVAQGTHEDLMKECSVYRSLYETQLISSQ
jgi:subfamily B ATP-binding cassette protein MsbA